MDRPEPQPAGHGASPATQSPRRRSVPVLDAATEAYHRALAASPKLTLVGAAEALLPKRVRRPGERRR